MKVLHVVASMDPKNGGVSKAVQVLVDGLKAYKVESEVVSLDHPEAPFLKDWSFPICGLGPGKSPWSYSNKLAPWLNAHFSTFNAIVIHGLWLYNSYATENALRQFKKKHQPSINERTTFPKLFVMPHGMLDPYFQRASGRKLKAYRNLVYWKLIERHTVNNADGLLFTCEEEKQLARQPFKPYFPKKEIVVGLGIESPPAYTDAMRMALLEKCSLGNDCSYVLFLSRIHEKKGVDLLINAYAEIYEGYLSKEKEVPDFANAKSNSNYPKLVIAGPDIETPYGQYIQKLVAENSLLKHVIHFTGMLSGNAKWGAFYGCEAFILPSHQENFGIAVVEALACSKPVLISNQVNIWREIEGAGGGIVADDTLEGTKQILQSWKDLLLQEKEAMGQKAKQCYLDNFSIHSAADKMLVALTS